MSDVLDQDGLHLKTLTELRDGLVADFETIYGADINTDPNSPDGQLLNIFAQAGEDLREILQQLNTSFDPDQSEGIILDQRVGINNIQRAGGTFTQTPVNITTDRALNLIGLDAEEETLNPEIPGLYTIKDDAGTEFYLLASYSFISASTQSLTFRAAEIGDVQVQINTITTPVEVVPGVTDINNPSGVTVQGEDEEPDVDLKIRRRQSTSISSVGFLDAMVAALNAIDGVTTAIVNENNTNITDGDGTLAKTVWIIVEGGDQDDIGAVIYAKKSAGAGMRGAVTVNVPRSIGGTFPVKFDRPINVNLYIRFTLTFPGGVFDDDFIKAQIVENIIWGVGAPATASTITTFVQSLNTGYQISSMEVSDDDITYVEILNTGDTQERFVNDVTRITIS